MRYLVLGPLEVRDGEERVLTVPDGLVADLLVILVLHSGRVVSVTRLVALLWDERPPQTAVAQVHSLVSQLRRAIGSAAVRTRSPGYVLDAAPDEVDLQVFALRAGEGRRRLASGDAAGAADALRSALDLWRGPPLAGVGSVAVTRTEVAGLEEARLAAVEDRVDAELTLGARAGLVAELEALLARHPLRERVRGQLMLALHRSGRRADALAVYREGRTLLVDELGLDPGGALQQIERAILADDDPPPASSPAAVRGVVPAQLPPDIVDFTGRQEQADRLHDQLAAVPRTAAVSVAVVVGTAGVGKTTLAVHVGHRLRAHFPDGQLYVDLRGAAATPPDPATVLGRFVRALSTDGAIVPDGLDERIALYRSLCSSRRMLVVLDNAASEAQVRPLLPGDAGCAVLVTSRRRLTGLPGASALDLGVLDGEQSTRLLAHAVDAERLAAEPDAAARIVRWCGGLPLAVRIAGARLSARPHWTLSRMAELLADERGRLDELASGDLEVRASLALSYLDLDPAARRAFRRLGWLRAPDFGAWVVAALLDIGMQRAEELVDGLVSEQLLEAVCPGSGARTRYRFHDLVRVYAGELAATEPAAARRAGVQRAVGGWLGLAEQAGRRLPSAAVGAGADPVPAWAPEASTVDAELADPLAWFDAEYSALVAATEQACEEGIDTLGCRFAWGVAPFLVLRARYDDWQRLCELACTAARRVGDGWAEADAVRGLGELGRIRNRGEPASDLLTWARDCFSAAGDRRGRALAEAGLGAVLRDAGRLDESAARLTGALAELREVGAPVDRVWTLRRLGGVHRLRGDHVAAEGHLREALVLVTGLDEPLAEAAVREGLGVVRLRRGDVREASAALDAALTLFRRHHYAYGEARALGSLGELCLQDGRAHRAVDYQLAALRMWTELRLPWWQARSRQRLGDAHAGAGQPAAARAQWLAARRAFTALDTRGPGTTPAMSDPGSP